MANRFQLDLKTFEISSKTSTFSLVMTSVAFIYDIPLQNITKDNLISLVQSKQLWLLPRGLCRLDVHMQLGDFDIGGDDRAGFFEFIAETICRSFLWSKLGLDVKILEVQPHQDNVPNLYFSIEQSDMSSALLSPPHARTAQIKGLECILRFEPSSNLKASPKDGQQGSSQSWMSSPIETLDSYHTSHASDLIDLWENAARLVDAAFCNTFGERKRTRGLRIFELEKAPTLLDLAPATWNSHYLRSTLNHTKNFPVISNILASSLKAQSPELRRKSAELLKSNIAEDNSNTSQELEHQTKQLESSIQRMLWNLLQDTLKPTIGMSRAARKPTSSKVELDQQVHEMGEMMVDEATTNEYASFDEFHYPYGTLTEPPSQGYDDYGNSASYNSDIEFGGEWAHNLTASSQGNQLPGTLEYQNQVGGFCYETDIYDEQLLETSHQYPGSDLSFTMQDHGMSDYIYDEDGDVYHECDHLNYTG